MKAYRVYYDKADKKWKCDNFLSEVGNDTDFEFWNASLSGAESDCIHYNNDFIVDAKDMISDHHYTICTCKDCRQNYIMTCNEYFWFRDKGLTIPKRCPKCRKRNK